MKKGILVGTACILLWAAYHGAKADNRALDAVVEKAHGTPGLPWHEQSTTRDESGLHMRLAQALYKSLRPKHQARCEAEAVTSCQARLTAYAAWIRDAAQKYELDPVLLGGLAIHESGLDPWAVSRVGARSIVQIHDDWKRHRSVRFIRSAEWRTHCRREMGECQAESIMFGAKKLRQYIDKCGRVTRGLQAYNKGRCGPRGKYARHVLALRDRIEGHLAE